MMQDLFMKALRQGSGFCKIQNPRAWLFEVARNALADRLKSEREALALPDDLAAPAPEDAPVDGLTACLPRVLSELNDADRQAIVLCDLGGMPQADYAAQVGLTLSAAKSRLQRARLRLRDRMATACQVTMGSGGRVEDFVLRPPLESPQQS
jgi:RNA polymerase sigma-70 factor (ECF subfamily)